SDAAHSFISRDYRVSVDPDTSKAFGAGLALLDQKGLIQWASNTLSTATAVVSTSIATSVASSRTAAASVAAIVQQTSTTSKSEAGHISKGCFMMAILFALQL
ncbi:hypothetical protein BC830DRAFT_1165428, partial [Chytriomyces sp. MP71]